MTVAPGGRGYAHEPHVEIALIQHESETLNVPARDLSAFLGNQEDDYGWSCAFFTERSFEEALARADRFDCLILGYNAISRSRELREALEAAFPDTGVLVLHQMQARAFECLRAVRGAELALSARPLLSAERTAVMTPEGVHGRLEVLLNWPHALGGAIGADPSPWEIAEGLVVPSDAAWRVVLEARTGGQRLPIVVRTPATARPRLAVCTLLIEPARPGHRELLANLVSFCARGLPEAVTFPPERAKPAWNLLRRKLALAGTHVVEVRGGPPAYKGWPEIGAGTVVVPAGGEFGADGWQGRGGRLVIMEENRLSAREGASDLRWIARRWAAELAGRPESDWIGGRSEGEVQLGSILATRAVLRVSELLGTPDYVHVHADEPGGLGLPDPAGEIVRRQVFDLLQRRRIDRGHIDQTVTATAAALDLDDLAGRVLRPAVRRRAEEWLRRRRDTAPVEDQLEIARRLPDAERFETALTQLEREGRPGQGVSPIVLTKVWHAATACQVPVPAEVAPAETSLEQLRESALVASSFLAALAHYREACDGELPAATGAAVEAALLTLRRRGTLLPRGVARRAPVESAAAEALALMMLFRHPARLLAAVSDDELPDAQVARPREPLAPALTEGLLAETARLRARNVDLELSRHRLALARNACAVAAVIATALAVVAVPGAPGNVGEWLTLATAALLVLLAGFAALGRWELLPAWALGVARFVGEGVGGLPGRLRDLAERGSRR